MKSNNYNKKKFININNIYTIVYNNINIIKKK